MTNILLSTHYLHVLSLINFMVSEFSVYNKLVYD